MSSNTYLCQYFLQNCALLDFANVASVTAAVIKIVKQPDRVCICVHCYNVSGAFRSRTTQLLRRAAGTRHATRSLSDSHVPLEFCKGT